MNHPNTENKDEMSEAALEVGQPKDLAYVAQVVGGALLLGSLLISGSIFYGVKQLGNQAPATAVVAGNNPSAPSAPSAPAQQPDNGPVTVTERKDAPVIGNPKAKVTLYEFSDFQCPFCQRFFNDTLPQIKSKYVDTGKVKLVYRHLPLPFHVNAQKAAEAGECANRQGKFEVYHDLLFKNGKSDGAGLAVEDLKKYAVTAGLNTGKFNQCLDNGEAVAAVKQDSDNASAIGISGTPSFVINNQKIVGAMPYATFEQAIEAALKK